MKKHIVASVLALIFLTEFCGIVQADLNDGLVAYYPFNGNANDESGNENNGVVNGAVLIEDRFGNADSAYSFDGIDDHIFISNSNHPTGEVTVTYSAWIFLKSNRSNDGVVIDIGNGRGDDVSNERSSILFAANTACIEYVGEYNDIYATTACVLQNQWFFIALTKSERNVNFFVNGGLQYSASHGSGQNISNTQMNIGLAKDYSTDSGYEPFSGFIDEVRIYNRALSEFEIQELYNESNFNEEFCETQYNEGYEAGRQICINNPTLCGISMLENNPATLSSMLEIHIPAIQFGAMSLWADFEFLGEINGDLIWKLSNYGQE